VFSVGGTTTSLRGLLAAIAVLVLTHWLSKAARNAARRKAKQLDDDGDSNRIYGIISLLVVWLIGVEVAFDLLGFDLSSLLAASGFLALGAGFVVRKIALRTTRADTLDGEQILIPNSLVAQSMVTNMTRHDRLFRIHVGAGVAY